MQARSILWSALMRASVNWSSCRQMESALVAGEKSSTVFTMNGVKFHYDALGGQKTGAFLDQRENYAAAAAIRQRRSA